MSSPPAPGPARPGPGPGQAPALLAWDLETCALPEDALSGRQRRRLDLLLAKDAAANGGGPRPGEAEAEQRARLCATHPALLWICSAAMAWPGDGGARAWSVTAASPAEEGDLLARWWAAVRRTARAATWVGFCSKTFDAPALLARSLAHGLAPEARGLLDRHPWRHAPHADLAGLLGRTPMGLADLCDLLGVPSPKTALDGGGVARAVAEGRLADVAAYNEADARATLACFLRAGRYL